METVSFDLIVNEAGEVVDVRWVVRPSPHATLRAFLDPQLGAPYEVDLVTLVSVGAYELESTEFESNVTLLVDQEADPCYVVDETPQ